LLDLYLYEKGKLEFMWSHGVISDEVWASTLHNCSFLHDLCSSNASEHTFEGGRMDCFNLYAPVCLQSPNGTYYSSSHVRSCPWNSSSHIVSCSTQILKCCN
jgi:serine carboxypeptidase-like clade II